MRFICIGDLHGAHWSFPIRHLPKGDVLLYAGDITCHGGLEEVTSFNNWLSKLDYKYKIVVAGNHDFCLKGNYSLNKVLLKNATYLQNEGIEIDGIKIWGSPLNVIKGYQWAFNDELEYQANIIPYGLDILLVHSPPHGIMDIISRNNGYGKAGDHCGSIELLNRLKLAKPKYCIFGHIHEGYGSFSDENTKYYNVAMQDEYGSMFKNGLPTHMPIILDIGEIT